MDKLLTPQYLAIQTGLTHQTIYNRHSADKTDKTRTLLNHQHTFVFSPCQNAELCRPKPSDT
jgi:hypothetical protein